MEYIHTDGWRDRSDSGTSSSKSPSPVAQSPSPGGIGLAGGDPYLATWASHGSRRQTRRVYPIGRLGELDGVHAVVVGYLQVRSSHTRVYPAGCVSQDEIDDPTTGR